MIEINYRAPEFREALAQHAGDVALENAAPGASADSITNAARSIVINVLKVLAIADSAKKMKALEGLGPQSKEALTRTIHQLHPSGGSSSPSRSRGTATPGSKPPITLSGGDCSCELTGRPTCEFVRLGDLRVRATECAELLASGPQSHVSGPPYLQLHGLPKPGKFNPDDVIWEAPPQAYVGLPLSIVLPRSPAPFVTRGGQITSVKALLLRITQNELNANAAAYTINVIGYQSVNVNLANTAATALPADYTTIGLGWSVIAFSQAEILLLPAYTDNVGRRIYQPWKLVNGDPLAVPPLPLEQTLVVDIPGYSAARDTIQVYPVTPGSEADRRIFGAG